MYLSIYPDRVLGLRCNVCSRGFLHGFVRPFHASKATSVHRHIGPFLLLPPLYFFFFFFLNRRIDLLVIIGERRRACDRATMEMHILPFVVPLVPYAALLALVGVRYSLSGKICNRIFSNLWKFSGFVRDLQSNFFNVRSKSIVVNLYPV